MRYRLPPWLVLLLLVGICGGVIVSVAVVRSGKTSTGALLSRLPSDGAVVVYLDFQALRRAHVLDIFSGSDMVREPEYRSFVDQTGFDYLHDLDSALVSFHRTGTFFLLRGKFDWRALEDYVKNQGGSCYNTLCKVEGSTPERRISYFPLQHNLMALAVSRDDVAVTELQGHRPVSKPEIPSEPVWAIIPTQALKNPAGLPAGTRMFARALEGANRILLSLGPDQNRLQVGLDVTCRSVQEAVSLASQLRGATAQLRGLIAKEHQVPNPRDLSGVLSAGTFEQKDLRVVGRWPLERSFLESLAGAGL